MAPTDRPSAGPTGTAGETRTNIRAQDRIKHGLPAPYPCEDLDNGLYLRPKHTDVTVINPPGDITPIVLVAAEDFMAVQKERDDLRRTVGLINAWRLSPGRSEIELDRLLKDAGQDLASAKAMLGILAWARENQADAHQADTQDRTDRT